MTHDRIAVSSPSSSNRPLVHRFVPECPEEYYRPPRWRDHIDNLVWRTPSAALWSRRFDDNGDSCTRDGRILTRLLEGTRPYTPMSLSRRHDDLLQRVKDYGDHERDYKAFEEPIRRCRTFLLVCAYNVLLGENIAKEQVDALMNNLHLGHSETYTPTYAARVRRAAKWVCACVHELRSLGWGYRSEELPILCRCHVRSPY